MVSDFLLLFFWLNLFSLLRDKQMQLETMWTLSKAVVYFKYGQERYWESVYLLDQVKKQALSIATVLYLGYQYFFLFDNATSHAIYLEDALRVQKINKGPGRQ